MTPLRAFSFLLAILTAQTGLAATLNVAVAANFTQTLKQLQPLFERRSGHQLKLSSASTGTLYAQILHGAPFDIFLAADTQRPTALIHNHRADADSALIYARGSLILWSPDPNKIISAESALIQANFNHIAIANPNTAPYGAAAMAVITHLDQANPDDNLSQKLSRKIVRGENIAQTWQFIVSGNAELGLIAKSQLILSGRENDGSYWNIPPTLYAPIEQMAVIITPSLPTGAAFEENDKTAAAKAFMHFLRSNEAQAVMHQHGYNIEHHPAQAASQ